MGGGLQPRIKPDFVWTIRSCRMGGQHPAQCCGSAKPRRETQRRLHSSSAARGSCPGTATSRIIGDFSPHHPRSLYNHFI